MSKRSLHSFFTLIIAASSLALSIASAAMWAWKGAINDNQGFPEVASSLRSVRSKVWGDPQLSFGGILIGYNNSLLPPPGTDHMTFMVTNDPNADLWFDKGGAQFHEITNVPKNGPLPLVHIGAKHVGKVSVVVKIFFFNITFDLIDTHTLKLAFTIENVP